MDRVSPKKPKDEEGALLSAIAPLDVLNGITDGIAVFDGEWRIVFLNAAARTVLSGFHPAPARLIGQVHWEAFPETVGTSLEQEYRRVQRERAPSELEYFHSGWKRWFAVRVFPVGEQSVCVFFRDIHHQKQREAELIEREQHVRMEYGEIETIYRSAPLGLAVLDLDLRFIRINEHLARINGIPAADHVGRKAADILPTIAEAIARIRDRVVATGEPVRFDLECPYPSEPGKMGVWDELWYPLRDETGKIIAVGAVVEGVTERRTRERRLSQEASMLANAMPQLVWTALPDGTVDYYNDRIADYSGAERTAEGRWRWAPMLHPEDEPGTIRAWTKAAEEGSTYTFTHRVRMRDGTYRWHLSRGVPVRDNTGAVVKWFGTATDIDEQKRAADELEEIVAQRTARLKETIAELESFSYSISHDMRAPLRAMQTYARYLEQEYGEKLAGDGQTYVSRIIKASDRLDHLIRDVLAYSRIARAEAPLVPTDVGVAIEELLATYPHFRGVDVAIEGTLPPVMANRAALTQCLSNLIGNAVKFVRPGEEAKVRISGQRSGDFIGLRFRDNGVGIAEEDRRRVFEMFYQIDVGTEGTGIGLSIVRKAAERMGGRITVEESSPGGTTFLLELPAVKG